MPAPCNSPAASQEPAGQSNESAEVYRAYLLISQLRQHSPAPVPVPRATPATRDRQRPEREARPLRAVGILAAQQA